MPLLGMTKTGEVFEENSVRNDGLGISHFPRYADEGNLELGGESQMGMANRLRATKIAKMQRQAVKQHNQREFQKNAQIANWKKRMAAKAHAEQQAKASRITRKNSDIFMKARGQRRMKEDYTSLMGDPNEGFGSEGTLVRDMNLVGELSGVDSIEEAPRFAGHLNMQERFGSAQAIAQAVAPQMLPRAPVRLHVTTHPMAMYSSHAAFYGYDGYGGFGWNPFKAAGKAIKKVAKGVGKVAKGVGKVAVKGIKVSAKVTGTLISKPIKIADKVIRKIPVVGHVYKGVDKLTGGTISSAVSLATLPGDALRGEKITKARLVNDLTFAVKLGAVALTGGSAAAVIGFSSGQLKKGPLGKTAIGRTLLSIGEVAGFATAGYQAATKVGAQAAGQAVGQATGQVTTQAAAQAGTQVATQAATQAGTQVAQASLQQAVQGALVQKAQNVAEQKAVAAIASKTGAVGGLIASVALNDPSKLSPENLANIPAAAGKVTGAQVLAFAEKKAEQKATQEFAKQTGIPVGAAGYVTDVVTGEKSPMTLPADIHKEVSELQLKAAKLSPASVQAHISNNAEALHVEVAKVPNLSMKLEERMANAKEIQNIEAGKILEMNKESAAKASRATEIQRALENEAVKLARLQKEANEASLAEKPKLAAEMRASEQKVIALNAQLKPAQTDAIQAMEKTQLLKSQAAIKVAAAEEGRYWPGYDVSHPMLQYGLVPRVAPKVVAAK